MGKITSLDICKISGNSSREVSNGLFPGIPWNSRMGIRELPAALIMGF